MEEYLLPTYLLLVFIYNFYIYHRTSKGCAAYINYRKKIQKNLKITKKNYKTRWLESRVIEEEKNEKMYSFW